MARVVIALGSNVGDCVAAIHRASELIGEFVACSRLSSLFETAPMYMEDQPRFLNAALMGVSEIGPCMLWRRLQEVERELGRIKRERNGPREIDLDLVAYGALEYRYREDGIVKLTVPHPRAWERRFVLEPAFDVCPDLVLPGYGPVSCLLEQTTDQALDVLRK